MHIFYIVYIKIFIIKIFRDVIFWVNKKMFEHLLFSFLLTTYFEGEWWGNMVILWLALEGTPTVSTAAVPRHIPTSERTRFPTSLHPCQQLLFSTFLIASNLVNIKLTAVLIYISPATSNVYIYRSLTVPLPLFPTCYIVTAYFVG